MRRSKISAQLGCIKLGKIITYASGKDANIIIWLVKHAREEHKAAIEWLNSHTDDNIGFFLCEFKLYRNADFAGKFKHITPSAKHCTHSCEYGAETE